MITRCGISANKNIVTGIALLALVAIVMAILLELRDLVPKAGGWCRSRTSLYVHGGYRFFEDEDIMDILRDRYCLDITGEFRLGTFAMSDQWHEEVDCVFPASLTGLDYFKQQHPGVIRADASNYQTPIVVYTWQDYLPDLEEAGLVVTTSKSAADGTSREIRYLQMDALIEAIESGKTWRDIGMDTPGEVVVGSTDPMESSSGLMWLALLATYMIPGNERGDRVVTLDDLNDNPDILPTLVDYWEKQGQQQSATNKLYVRFITAGAGMPMIGSYENTFIGWYNLELPAELKPQADRIVGLYPAEQTFITQEFVASTSPACDQMIDVFADPEIERIAWAHFGLRNGAGGIGALPGDAPWLIDRVFGFNEPKPNVTDEIKAAICDYSPESCE